MNNIKLMIPTEFGLEAVTKRELQSLGYNRLTVENGRIIVDAELADVPILNINLRTAERVLILCDQFKAFTFEHLFQGVKKYEWEKWIVPTGKIIVKGRSKNSKLHSVPSCQSIVKKAIIERLSKVFNKSRFPENGPTYVIEVVLEKDIARIILDTSGKGLHKRGYRENAGEAPIKETLAAGMIMLSYWQPDRVLLDPMCGSGTIAIEAAMLARNIAPGLGRKFSAEEWGTVPAEYWKKARSNAMSAIKQDMALEIKGCDIDPQMIAIAKENAIEAGIEDDISFAVCDIVDTNIDKEYGVLITNPPYGERIGSDVDVEQINYSLKEIMYKNKTWSYYVVTADSELESSVNRKADRKRKFYNGRIKVDYYQFYGPRPPRE